MIGATLCLPDRALYRAFQKLVVTHTGRENANEDPLSVTLWTATCPQVYFFSKSIIVSFSPLSVSFTQLSQQYSIHNKMRFSSSVLPLMGTIGFLAHQIFCSPVKEVRQTSVPSGQVKRYEIQTPPLSTRWTYSVTPEQRWPSYPRPQLQRSEWQSLNGIWRWLEAAQRFQNGLIPSAGAFTTEVLVPSCLESGLSGNRRLSLL